MILGGGARWDQALALAGPRLLDPLGGQALAGRWLLGDTYTFADMMADARRVAIRTGCRVIVLQDGATWIALLGRPLR